MIRNAATTAGRGLAHRTRREVLWGLRDATAALKLSFFATAPKLPASWIQVPFGLSLILAFCFAVHIGLASAGVQFPASVACLILLFAALLLSEVTLGNHRTKQLVNLIDVPAGWALRWINILFAPSFILLPLSPAIGGVEVAKIAAVFLIGFVVMMAFAAYLTRSIQLVLGTSKRAATDRAEELTETAAVAADTETFAFAELSPSRRNSDDGIRTGNTTPFSSAPGSRPLSTVPSSVSLNTIAPPPASQAAFHLFSLHHHPVRPVPGTGPDASDLSTAALVPTSMPAQAPLPDPRAHVWAAVLTAHHDRLLYLFLFLLIGLPIYYSTGYAMPAHLTLTVLCYFAAMAVPPAWRQYAHPVLVTAALAILSIWALAAVKGDGLLTALRVYRTGANYQALWRPTLLSRPSSALRGPGAGDVLATVLDAAIVSLALPMFRHRRELRAHFAAIVIPSISLSVGSLLAYPPLCFAIGISAERSLAFAARSLTLALAIPATENLGGDTNLVAALAIMSGIFGVLVGERMLRLFKIPEDDYVTRGVTLGANSSAIATALLLRTDPRAAALSSLSMSLFGTITVLFTSIPPMVVIVRSWVGL
ncbi:LrgB-like family-domain-containing protein [Plectosphaerella plurivora]|uniref:LrgB-like family-domain-containing protein n=1 Tax=Plectosphaerella plurivora TaxID=936078 RepID=A0A9P8V085_9PEZI|nr:LrgB-like family-domain-containing protein [Plectosphaerella plurivora]